MHSPSSPLTAGETTGSGSIIVDTVRGWDRFWFSPRDPIALSFIRLFAGMVIFYVHLTYSWDLLSFVGPEAWLSKDVSDYIRREAPFYGQGTGWDEQLKQMGTGNYYWSVFCHVTDPRWIVAVHVFFLASMLCMTAGLWTRVTTALSWVGAMCYVQRAASTVFGLDTMMMIVLLYLLIGPAGARLSLDNWLRKRRARKQGRPVEEVQPSITANFAIRLIQVHFCIIYLASGTSKLLGATWWSGTALNIIMLNAEFAPLNHPMYYEFMKFLAGHRWMWETFMAFHIVGTLVLEVGFPFLVWYQRTRWLMICGSVMLHTGIAIFMGLTTFSLIMIVLVSSFIPPEVISALFSRLSERFSQLVAARAEKAGRRRELVLTR